MNTKELSSDLSCFMSGEPQPMFASLESMASKAAKKSGKQSAQTEYQAYLKGLIDKSGLSFADIERESRKANWPLPVSTVRSAIYETTNHQIKTIEGLALVLGKDPLHVISHALDNPPATKEELADSLVGTVWNLYRRLESEDDKRVADSLLENLISYLRASINRQGRG